MEKCLTHGGRRARFSAALKKVLSTSGCLQRGKQQKAHMCRCTDLHTMLPPIFNLGLGCMHQSQKKSWLQFLRCCRCIHSKHRGAPSGEPETVLNGNGSMTAIFAMAVSIGIC